MTFTRLSLRRIRKRFSHCTDSSVTASSAPSRLPRTSTDAVILRHSHTSFPSIRAPRAKRMLFSFVLMVVLVGSDARAFAQGREAAITGRVLDPDGAVVPDAHVAIHASDRPYSAAAQTDSEGRYRLAHLGTGDYLISADAPGLTSPTSSLSLKLGQSEHFDITLSVAAVAEHVVVTAVDGSHTLQTVGKTMSVVSGNDLDTREIFDVADALRVRPRIAGPAARRLWRIYFGPGAWAPATAHGGAHRRFPFPRRVRDAGRQCRLCPGSVDRRH
jgi:hypothetical protein